MPQLPCTRNSKGRLCCPSIPVISLLFITSTCWPAEKERYDGFELKIHTNLFLLFLDYCMLFKLMLIPATDSIILYLPHLQNIHYCCGNLYPNLRTQKEILIFTSTFLRQSGISWALVLLLQTLRIS